MINKQLASYFGSQIFRFIGNGGMMAASYYDGMPDAYTVPTGITIKTYASVVVSSGPTMYWQMAEASGTEIFDTMNTSNGQYLNTPILGASALVADSSGAVDFNGTNEYAYVTAPPSFGKSMSVVSWVFCDVSAVNAGIVSERWTGSGNRVDFQMSLGGAVAGSNTQLEFGRHGSAAWDGRVSAPHPFPLNRVVHAVAVASVLDYTLYMNAVRVARATAITTTIATAATSDAIYVGARFNISGTHPYWDGRISDAAVYDKAITYAEIKRQYAYGRGYHDTTYPYAVITDGAEYYWRLNETGSTVYNTVGTDAYDLGITGGPLKDQPPILAGQAASMSFDGINDRLVVPEIPTLTSASYEVTLQSASAVTDNRFLSFNKQAPFTLFRFSNTTTLNLLLNTGGTQENVYASGVEQTAPLHCVGTYKQSAGMTLSVNGTLIGTASAPATFNQTTNLFNNIGSDRTPTTFFDGNIGEVIVYPSQLTADQIRIHNALARGFTPGSYRYEVMMDDPAMYMPMDGDAVDTAASEVNVWAYGSYVGGANLVAPALIDEATYAVNLDGVNDYLSFPTGPETDANFTTEIWAKCSASSPACGMLSDKYTGSGNSVQWCIGLGDPGGTLETKPFFGHYTGTSWQYVSSGAPMVLNQTQHIVGVASAKVYRIFINAVEQGVASVTVSARAETVNEMRIGARWDAAGTHPYFDGVMSDTAIYASALTAAKIKKHYALGRGYVEGSYPFTVITDGATQYLRLDQADVSAQVSRTGHPFSCDALRSSKINTLAAPIVADSDYCAYFSSYATELTDPCFVYTSATTGAVPIRTVESWFNLNDLSADSNIFTLYGSNTDRSLMRLVTSDDKLEVYSGNAAARVMNTSTTIDASVTYQTVITYDGSVSSLYIDGELEDTYVGDSGGMNVASDLIIGANRFSALYYASMKGRISDVTTYTTALSSTIVRDHYKKGLNATTYMQAVLDSEPLGYWRLHEDNLFGFESIVPAPALTLVRATAKVSTAASSLIENEDTNSGSIYFNQTGGAATSNAVFQADAIASAGAPMRSFETWFKINTEVHSRHLLGTYISDTNRFLLRRYTGNRIGVYDGVVAVVSSDASVVNSGEIHHTVVTYDDTTTRLYLDGRLIGSAVGDPGGVGGPRLLVGGYQGAAGRFGSMDGWMDEVAVYTHVLTPDEIKRHYVLGSRIFT